MGASALVVLLVSIGLSSGKQPDLSTAIEPEYMPIPPHDTHHHNALMTNDFLLSTEPEYLPAHPKDPFDDVPPSPAVIEPEYANWPKRPVAEVDGSPNAAEPEYARFRANPHRTRPVRPQLEKGGRISEVKDYVNKFHGLTSFLEVSSKVQSSDKQEAESFLDAELTDDLAGDMKTVKAGEKWVVKNKPSSFFAFRPKTSQESQPETAPAYLEQDQKAVFQQLAERYEKNFQGHFREGSSHTETHAVPASVVETYEIRVEPQVLLPVPASLLFETVAKYRDQLRANMFRKTEQQQQSTERTEQRTEQRFEQQRTQQRTEQKPTFLDIHSTTNAEQKAMPMGMPMPPPELMDTFIDPYPEMIPAAVLGGGCCPGGPKCTVCNAKPEYPAILGPPPRTGYTSTFVANQGRVQASPPAGYPAFGVYSMGVEQPAPPLRPDNLPPPPYVKPLIVEAKTEGTGAAPAAAAGGKK